MQLTYGPDSAEEGLNLGTVEQNPRCRDRYQRNISSPSFVCVCVSCTY